jgi:type I restriction enzyme S subunit
MKRKQASNTIVQQPGAHLYRRFTWPKKRLGDLAEFRNGVNYNSNSFGVGVKVVGVSDFQDYTKPRYAELDQINPEGIVTERNILRDGDIVFVRSNGNRGLIGRSLFIEQPPEEVTHSAFTIRLRFISREVHPKFYAYCFRTPLIRHELTAQGGGTNINNLNQDILNALEVPVPPLFIQRRIAGILSAYDELMENCQRRIRILEEIVRAIYREWFVHFRFPGHEKIPRVDSSIRPLPHGWEVKKVKDVCHLTMGQSPKSEFYNESGVGMPFHQGVTDFGERFPSDRLFCTTEGRIAEAGDILFSVRAPVGRMNIANKRLIIGRGLSAIRHRDGFQSFLWEQLRARFTKDDMIGNGAIFAAVTKDDMQSIELICPPAPLITAATRHLEPIHRESAVLSEKVVNLRSTRDLLLPRLLSGQLNVGKAMEA